jgi:hypothetical protein
MVGVQRQPLINLMIWEQGDNSIGLVEINVSDFSPGIYLMQCIDKEKGEVYTSKFIKN